MNNEEFLTSVGQSNSRTLDILNRLMLPWANLVLEEPTCEERFTASQLTANRLRYNPIKLTDEIINDAILIQINYFIHSGKFKPSLKNRIKFCHHVIGTCVNLTKDEKNQLISRMKNLFAKKLNLNDGDSEQVKKILNKIHKKFGLVGLEVLETEFYQQQINTINSLFSFFENFDYADDFNDCLSPNLPI